MLVWCTISERPELICAQRLPVFTQLRGPAAILVRSRDTCSDSIAKLFQKGLEVCYCLWGCHPDPRLGPVLGPSRSHPGSEGVPSRFAMCNVFQHFGPIQVPRWGPCRPVLVPSCSRAFLPGSGLDGPKQTSRPLPIFLKWSITQLSRKIGYRTDVPV